MAGREGRDEPRGAARLAGLLAQAPAIIWVLRGPDLVVEFCNAPAHASVGFREPLVGLPVFEALPELRGQGLDEVLARVLATGEEEGEPERHTLVPLPDGGVREAVYSYAMIPLRDADDDVDGVLIHAVDVTDLVRAREDAERAHARLARVERVTQALGGARSDADVGAVLVEQARAALGAETGVVYVAEDGALRLLAASGYPDGSLEGWERVTLDVPAPIPDAVRTGRAVVLETREEMEAAYPYWRDSDELLDQALVALPVTVGAEVLGGLLFSFTTPRHFDTDELRLVGILAGHSALALARLALVSGERARATRAALVERLSRTLDDALGVRERMGRLARACVPEAADLAVVRLREGGQPAAAAVRLVAGEVEFVPPGSVGAAPGAATVVAAGRPRVVPEPDPAAWPAEAALLGRDGGLGPLVCVPLAARGHALGTLTLARSAQGAPLGPVDLALAEAIADRAAIALDNARLYDQERLARATLDRARARAERLQRVTAALSRALTEEQVAGVVVTEAMDALRARAGVIARREGGRGRVLSAVGYPDEVLHAGMAFPIDAGFPLAAVLRSGESFWFEDPADWARRFPPPRSGLGPAGLALPLVIDGSVTGAIAFRFGDEQRRITSGERRLIGTLAEQCAQALERARLYEREHEAAEVLQRRLLPERLPEPGFARLAVRYLPAAQGRSGGDFYDAVELPGGRLAMIVGDVVGQGVGAAAVMGQLRSAWRALSDEVEGPAAMLQRLSRFAESTSGAGVATAACLELRPDGALLHACAGHPPPVVATLRGARALTDGRGIPLGSGTWTYREARDELPAGGLLMLYTDGAYERRGRPLDEGLERLRAWVGDNAAAPLEELLDGLVAAMRPSPDDDCALMAVRRER